MANIQDLSSLFDSGNFGLLDRGLQAQALDQEKRKADLATVLGQEQRNQAMHPWDVEAKQAVTGLNKSTTALNQYALDTKLPVAQATDMNLQKFFKESDDLTRERTKANVVRYMQIAAAAKKNGGQLPPGINVSPQEMQYFAPQHLDKLIQFGQTFLENDPTEIAARQRAKEQMERTNAQGQWGVDRKTAPSGGSGGGVKPNALPQSYADVLAGMGKLKKAGERLAYLKSVLPALSKDLQMELQPAYKGLRQQAEAEANARNAGGVDIAGATKGKVPVRPDVNLGDAPGGAQKKPEAVAPKYTQADLEFTAKKYGMTIEQVKKQLGIK